MPPPDDGFRPDPAPSGDPLPDSPPDAAAPLSRLGVGGPGGPAPSDLPPDVPRATGGRPADPTPRRDPPHQQPPGFVRRLTAAMSPGGAHAATEALSAGDVEEMRRRTLGFDQAEGEIAEELSAVLALAERIKSRQCQVENAPERLRFVLDCILASPARLVLARDARLRMQIEVYQKSGMIARTLAWISAGSSVALVLAALVASLVIWMVVFAGLHGLYGVVKQGSSMRSILFMDLDLLSVVMPAAILGGVVSIGTRLKEFARVRDLDPFAMFWTAMLKPLIGVVLAVVVLAALTGGVVGFDAIGVTAEVLGRGVTPPKVLYALWIVSFFTGFSERFAWDFVDRAQAPFAAGARVPPPVPVATGGAVAGGAKL